MCTCGNLDPHPIARKTTADGVTATFGATAS